MEGYRMKKFLVVSDLHIPTRNSDVPEIILNLVKEVDGIIGLGDYVSMDVVGLFKGLTVFHGVHGNMDFPDVKDFLPFNKLMVIENVKVGLCHGWGPPWGIEERILETFDERPDVILFGHTHYSADKTIGGVRYLNPGATEKGGSFGILTLDGGKVVFEIKRCP